LNHRGPEFTEGSSPVGSAVVKGYLKIRRLIVEVGLFDSVTL
jgi:hypothetical protein